MRRAQLGLLVLVLTGALGGGGAAAAEPFGWRVAPDDFAAYRIEVLERKDSRFDGHARWGEIDDVAGFHGYELAADGLRVIRDVTHAELLYVPFVFTLPDRPVRGAKRKLEETLGGNWRMQPFRARGQVRVTAGPRQTKTAAIELAGKVWFEDHPEAPHTAYYRLKTGSLGWTARFDLEHGRMQEVTYHLKWTITSGPRPPPRSVHKVDPHARTASAHVRLTLDRVMAHRYRGFQSDIDRAIADGLDYLESRQRDDGSWYRFGRSALALLALVDGGRPPEHPSVKRGFDWLLKQTPWTGKERKYAVYGMGVAVMALERRRTPPEEVERRRRGLATEFLPRRLTGLERAWMSRCVGFLLDVVRIQDRLSERGAAVTGHPIAERWRWGYGRKDNDTYWDNSNSQYAVLGLESAARCGIPVPGRAWIGIANHFLAVQGGDGAERRDLRIERGGPRKPQGRPGTRPGTRSAAPVVTRSRGWSYREMPRARPATPAHERAYGAMTTAGIGSLAIARSRIGRLPDARFHQDLIEWIDQAILDGFASLDDWFTVWMHPRYEGWYTYYLYGLERAGMLTAVRRFGRHDWYWEGAVQLLRRRSDYGQGKYRYWSYDYHGEGTTAWAILFLKRGTPPVITPR